MPRDVCVDREGNIVITQENVFTLALLSKQISVLDVLILCESYLTKLIAVNDFNKMDVKQVIDIYVTLPDSPTIKFACETYIASNIAVVKTVKDPR
jgi:hypothetical protein